MTRQRMKLVLTYLSISHIDEDDFEPSHCKVFTSNLLILRNLFVYWPWSAKVDAADLV